MLILLNIRDLYQLEETLSSITSIYIITTASRGILFSLLGIPPYEAFQFRPGGILKSSSMSGGVIELP